MRNRFTDAYTVVARYANWMLIAESSGKYKRLYSLQGELRNVNVAHRYPQLGSALAAVTAGGLAAWALTRRR